MGDIPEEKDQKIHEKEKRQFIREQLRPQRKKTLFRFIRSISMVLGAAVLFGGIAALSFYVMQIYFPWQDLDDGINIVTSNRPARNTEPAVKTISDEIDETVLNSVEDYERISKQLSAIGEGANAAIVGLGTSNNNVLQGNNSQQYCGILFHENAHYYHILSEYASAQNTENIRVRFFDGKEVDGSLVGRDSSLNLAIFQVDKSVLAEEEQKKLMVASMGDTASLDLGAYILAVGKPNGNLFSVHTGRITEDAIAMPVTDHELQLFTTSIPYQAGRSGFVLNIQGQLLGMLTADYTNVSGKVDAAFVSFSGLMPDLNLLLRGKTAPYLGITGTNIAKEEAESLGIMEGIYIDSLDAGSPAYEGKMRVADVVAAVDGEQVHSVQELHNLLLQKQSGREVEITIYRQVNDKNQKKNLTILLR